MDGARIQQTDYTEKNRLFCSALGYRWMLVDRELVPPAGDNLNQFFETMQEWNELLSQNAGRLADPASADARSCSEGNHRIGS